MSKMLTGWKGKPSLRCVLRKSGGEFEYHLGMKQTSLPLANMTEIPALSELSLFNDTIPRTYLFIILIFTQIEQMPFDSRSIESAIGFRHVERTFGHFLQSVVSHPDDTLTTHTS